MVHAIGIYKMTFVRKLVKESSHSRDSQYSHKILQTIELFTMQTVLYL